MTEGKINWNYTCPICENTFPYGIFAGAPMKECDGCKAQIKEMVRSTGGGYY